MSRLVNCALVASAALVVCLIAPTQSLAGRDADAVARALESDPVYVHPRVARRLPVPDQGRVRIQITRHAIGRIKIAVVPEALARREGGVGELANNVDAMLQAPGALIVVAGPDYHVITSHPRSEATVNALRSAVARHTDDGLAAQLLDAVRGIGRVDPGPAEDLRQPAGSPDGVGGLPQADDFLDDIKDAFKLGVFIVAAAIALPFVLVALYFLYRVRRRAAREEEVQESAEGSARRELVNLGDGVRSLDIDTSMPGANRAGIAAYEQALASYDQANELLAGDPSEHRVNQARAAIATGERNIAEARRLLG